MEFIDRTIFAEILFQLSFHCILYVNLFLGLSDVPGEAMVKLYCPKCMDVYTPKSSRHHHTDGAYFGTGFPHMLFMVHPEYRPKKPTNQFVPRLYGFKIHPLAYQIQQQGASNFKVPMRTVSYNNGRKWELIVCLLCHWIYFM